VYLKDTGTQQALVKDNKTDFKLNSLRLIQFKGIVYLLKQIRKQFVKKLLLLLKALMASKILFSKTESSLALLLKTVLLHFEYVLPASKGRLNVIRYPLADTFRAAT